VHRTQDLPKLLGLGIGRTHQFLREHRDKLRSVKSGAGRYYTDAHVAEMRPLVQLWLQALHAPDKVHGIPSMARALGLKPYLIVELMKEFEMPVRQGLTLKEIEDLKSVIPLFLAERERKKTQEEEQRQALRQGRQKLIRPVGERATRGYDRADILEAREEEQRRWAPHEKVRKCLRCLQNFQSEWAGNRMCEPCKKSVEVP
jgi:hypothetical protein